MFFHIPVQSGAVDTFLDEGVLQLIRERHIVVHQADIDRVESGCIPLPDRKTPDRNPLLDAQPLLVVVHIPVAVELLHAGRQHLQVHPGRVEMSDKASELCLRSSGNIHGKPRYDKSDSHLCFPFSAFFAPACGCFRRSIPDQRSGDISFSHTKMISVPAALPARRVFPLPRLVTLLPQE